MLVQALLDWMQNSAADHTGTFAALSQPTAQNLPPWQDSVFVEWHGRWKNRLQQDGQPAALVSARMQAHNPAVIPRNHAVEAALQAAANGDLTPCHSPLAGLKAPYDFQRHRPSDLTAPPPAEAPPYRTFCGT